MCIRDSVLIEAFARVAKMYPDTTLVFTGAKGSMEVRLAQEIKEHRISDRVKRLGYIPSADLDALYREAVALTFPSRFEGFGAPVLEAMARGCPVIASDATAVPEVLGAAGMLVSPDNASHWTEAMRDMLENPELAGTFRKTGLDRAGEFGWDRSASILQDAYRHGLETTL